MSQEEKVIEISESFDPLEATRLESAIRGWKNPSGEDMFLDNEASVCRSLDKIADAINNLADAVRGKS